MSEKLPRRESSIQRIVGLKKEDDPEGLHRFFDAQAKYVEQLPFEQEKSPELVEAINQANRFLKSFFGRYGIEWQKVPIEKIHLLDPIEWQKRNPSLKKETDLGDGKINISTTLGYFAPDDRNVKIFQLENPKEHLALLNVIVHEMIHANMFYSLHPVKEKQPSTISLSRKREDGQETHETLLLTWRRSGFNISGRTGHSFFHWLNEALTEELAARFDAEYFSRIPYTTAEYAAREAVIQQTLSSPAQIKRARRYVANPAQGVNEKGQTTLRYDPRPYEIHRKALETYLAKLYGKNREQFASQQEVFKLFVNAAWDGNILPVARLVESTFGKGSFRELAERMGANRDELANT